MEALLDKSGNSTTDRREEKSPYGYNLSFSAYKLGKVTRRPDSVLISSEEHRKVFPETPLIPFRRCKNLKDILARARPSREGVRGHNSRVCSRCGKSSCQICNVMCNSDSLHSTATNKGYRTNFSLTVTRPILRICWNVMCVLSSMLVVLTHPLGLDLIIIRRAGLSLTLGTQYPKRIFSEI